MGFCPPVSASTTMGRTHTHISMDILKQTPLLLPPRSILQSLIPFTSSITLLFLSTPVLFPGHRVISLPSYINNNIFIFLADLLFCHASTLLCISNYKKKSNEHKIWSVSSIKQRIHRYKRTFRQKFLSTNKQDNDSINDSYLGIITTQRLNH